MLGFKCVIYLSLLYVTYNDCKASSLSGEVKYDVQLTLDRLPEVVETLTTPLHHQETYTNGTMCDITMKPRRIDVNYSCGSGKTIRIESIEETETCVYRMRVIVPELCDHSLFVTFVPPKVEPIVCNPVMSADKLDKEKAKNTFNQSDKTSSTTKTPSMTHQRSTRVITGETIRNKMQHRRWLVGRRLVRRLMGKFLRTLSDPVPINPDFRAPMVFSKYFSAVAMATHTAKSIPPFSNTLADDDVQRWMMEVKRMTLKLTKSTQRIMSMRSTSEEYSEQAVRVMHSLGTFYHALVESKIAAFGEGRHSASLYTHEKILRLTNVYSSIVDEIVGLKNVSSMIDIRERLAILYAFRMILDPFKPNDLVGKNTEGDDMAFPLNGVTENPSDSQQFSPASLHRLIIWSGWFKRHLVILERFQTILEENKALRNAKSMFEHVLDDLKSNVVVVRGMDNGEPSVELDDDSNSSPSSNTRGANPLLDLIKKVLIRAESQQSRDFEIYQTTTSKKGYSTFYIMANEKRGKERRRITAMENTYKYTSPSDSTEHTSDD